FSDVSQLPDPSPEQDDFVRKMFTTDEDGTVVTAPEMDYLVHKYAALTAAQLGEILSTGSLIVTTLDGKQVPLMMDESERPFVRTLFIRKSGLKPDAAGKDNKNPGRGGGDAKLVAGWHATEQSKDRTTAKAARAAA